MTKYSIVMTPTQCRVTRCIISIRPTYSCAGALAYLHSWLRTYKTDNISETVEYRAKATINGIHKIVHWLWIAAKVYDLE